MTRLFTDGAESGNTLGFSNILGTVSASTAQKRTGSYSYRVSSSATVKAGAIVNVGDVAEIYVRFGTWQQYYTSSFFSWCSDSATQLGYIKLNSSAHLELYINTTLVATSDLVMYTGIWYLVEVRIKIANDATGVVTVKINNVPFIDYSGDTQPSTAGTIHQVDFLGTPSDYNYYDDIAINNTSGSADNSWCGDGYIIALKPNANGDSSDLVGSDGNSTDNYLLVDDVPHDSDTTYVESATGDDYDLYNLAACGLGDTHVIQRVWTESTAKDTTTAGGQIKHVMKTNSTEYDSAAISLSTAYQLNKGAEQLVNPQTTSAWTPAELDALQVGVKIVA